MALSIGVAHAGEGTTPRGIAHLDHVWGMMENHGYNQIIGNPYATLEAGFDLPCLNHACDASAKVMNDLFGGGYE